MRRVEKGVQEKWRVEGGEKIEKKLKKIEVKTSSYCTVWSIEGSYTVWSRKESFYTWVRLQWVTLLPGLEKTSRKVISCTNWSRRGIYLCCVIQNKSRVSKLPIYGIPQDDYKFGVGVCTVDVVSRGVSRKIQTSVPRSSLPSIVLRHGVRCEIT